MARQPVGALVELPIGQSFSIELYRDGIRRELNLLFEKFVHAPVFGIVGRRPIPLDEQFLPLGGGQHGQIRYALVRICGHCFQQGADVSGHALDTGFVEQIGAIFDVEIETVGPVRHEHREVKFRSSTLG